MNINFNTIKDNLIADNVVLTKETFQGYLTDDLYDIVIMHDSINHLDEDACIKLKNDDSAREKYMMYFNKVSKMMKSGGILIISDCSRYNFWGGLLKMRNPVASAIQWHKHQSPNLWTELLEKRGFSKIKLKWSSFNRLGNIGSSVLSNKLFSFFLTSHFNLYLKKE